MQPSTNLNVCERNAAKENTYNMNCSSCRCLLSTLLQAEIGKPACSLCCSRNRNDGQAAECHVTASPKGRALLGVLQRNEIFVAKHLLHSCCQSVSSQSNGRWKHYRSFNSPQPTQIGRWFTHSKSMRQVPHQVPTKHPDVFKGCCN